MADLHTLAWAGLASLACDAACDSFITLTLVYYLHTSRTGFKRTESLINRLITWTINTGLLTSIFAIADFICILTMESNLVYVGVFFVVSKLYTNSILASVNMRATLKKGSHIISGTTLESGRGTLNLVALSTTQQSTRATSSSNQGAGKQTSSFEEMYHSQSENVVSM